MTLPIDTLIALIGEALNTDAQTDRRLFHGRGRTQIGLEQITVDLIAKQVVVSLFKPETESDLEQLKALLLNAYLAHWQAKYALKSLLLQFRFVGAPTMDVLAGEVDGKPIFIENDMQFQLTLGKNQNSGLFLDMKNGRDWVRKNSQNKQVLNLFAYTCGFSVAAIEGGASSVVNVDMAKAALSTGRDNHRLNGHDVGRVKFFGHDIFKSWGKIKKAGPYDLVIIDPPSFQKGSFALTNDYQKILRRLESLTSSNAKVLACVNSPAVSSQFLIDGMSEHAPIFQYDGRIDNPAEFADIDNEASLKTLLFTRQ
jgi:23S rRNA (cytosine1962-C5)-methyltransferase